MQDWIKVSLAGMFFVVCVGLIYVELYSRSVIAVGELRYFKGTVEFEQSQLYSYARQLEYPILEVK